MNGTKVPQEKLTTSLKRSLAPTSSGLQPFEVIVITNQEVKEKIRPISWNQSVVTDCLIYLYLPGILTLQTH
jgi:hypothetical protein